MKVGLVTSVPLVPPWDQGDKNLAYRLTGALPHVCFQVLTTRADPPPSGANLQLQPLYRSRRPSVVQKVRVYGWFLFAAHRSAPDLYHLVYQPMGLSSRFIKWLPEFRRRPSLHTVPATTEGHTVDPGLFVADRIVALSQHGRRILQKAGLQDVVHIPQGIDVEEWVALDGQREPLKARLGMTDRRVLLYSGHFSPGYGVRVLVKALPDIMTRVPDMCLVLACRPRSARDHEHERFVRQEIARMGLDKEVLFYRTVSDMKGLIGASDLVVMPFQTMRDKVDIPTTLLEALGAGKPVVISDIPPMNELVQDEDSAGQGGAVGLTVPPGDASALAEAVVALLCEEDILRRMGQRAQALVRRRYDIRQVARQYEQLYREILR